MQGAYRSWSKLAPRLRKRVEPWTRPGNPRLRWRFWIVCTALIVIVIGQAGYGVWEDRQTALETQRRDVSNFGLVLAAQTTRYLDVFDTALQRVQQKVVDTSGGSVEALRNRLSQPDVREDLTDLIRNVPGDPALLVLDSDGVLINFTRSDSVPNLSAADRDFFTHFRERNDRELFISEPAKSRVTGQWTLFLSRRLSAADGRFLGVVAAAVAVDDLVGFYRTVLATNKEAITLLRADGVVVARYPDPEGTIGTSMPKTSPWYGVVANKGGTYRSPGFFGARPSIVSARPLDAYPLVIDVVVSEQEIFAAWRTNTVLDLLETAVIALSLLALFKIIDSHMRRQHDLAQFANALVEAMPGAFVAVDPAGRISRWNTNLPNLSGRADEELRGAEFSSIAVESDRDAVGTAVRAAFARGYASFECGLVHKGTGDVRTIFWSARTLETGGRSTLLAVGLDITETRVAELKRRESDERFRLQADQYATVLATTGDGFFVLDAGGKFIEANEAYCRMSGYSRDELSNIGITEVEAVKSPEETKRHMAAMASSGFERFETRHRKKNGELFDIESSVSFWRGSFLCFARDITARKQAEEQLNKLARYDLLTGLANRRIFVDALDHEIARARRGARGFAVLYLDLDHFKDVNDTLGHPAGDLLLRAVADRLRLSIRSTDVVARFGGDEFAILLTEIEDAGHVAIVADRIAEAVSETLAASRAGVVAAAVADEVLHTVAEPFAIQGNEIRTGTSIGIAVYGSDVGDAEAILSRADVALYRAKAEGGGSYRFFDPAMEAEVRARVALGIELREAIASNQLYLMYQPQVEVASGRIVGLEALVRWNHPTRGVVSPNQFIPDAERNGLIVQLGHWVLAEACRQAKRWLDAGVALPRVAVNLSAVQFKRPVEFERDIAAILAETGLPAQSLELELTESVLMEASAEHNDLLLRFRQTGYRIAIDDFGSGYSSLDYLRRYPVDRIKIAQSFIADIGQTPGNDAIVRAALGLARELNIEVVVEGVESAEQLELLKTWDCRIVQGFYFSRPVPVAEVTALLRDGKIVPSRRDARKAAAVLA